MVNCDAYYRCKTIIHIFIVTRLEKKKNVISWILISLSVSLLCNWIDVVITLCLGG